MSTLGNYMFQSFNFRNKTKLRPFYSLVSSIFAGELGHVELVSAGISMLNCGPGNPEENVDISKAPFQDMQDVRLAGSFLANGGGAMPMNANAASPATTGPWPRTTHPRKCSGASKLYKKSR